MTDNIVLPKGGCSTAPVQNKTQVTPPKRLRVSKIKQVREIEVVVDDAGTTQVYLLKEMDSPVRDAWVQDQQTRVALDESGKPIHGGTNMNGFYANLIDKCLYGPVQTDADGNVIYSDPSCNRKVTTQDVNAFPSSAQIDLFNECETLNALNRIGKEQAKKA